MSQIGPETNAIPDCEETFRRQQTRSIWILSRRTPIFVPPEAARIPQKTKKLTLQLPRTGNEGNEERDSSLM